METYRNDSLTPQTAPPGLLERIRMRQIPSPGGGPTTAADPAYGRARYWKSALWKPRWLAEVLSLDPATIRLWIKKGTIKANRVGGSWRIPIGEVRRFVPFQDTPAALAETAVTSSASIPGVAQTALVPQPAISQQSETGATK